MSTITPQPKVNFYTQVSLDAHERCRRLQARTGYSMPELVAEALQALESSLDEHQLVAEILQSLNEQPASAGSEARA